MTKPTQKPKPTKAQKLIRESLIQQLKDKGADLSHFTSLIDDYLYYHQQEAEMQADVRANGRLIDAVSARGVSYRRDNPAIKDAVLYNRQKLSILSELDLTTDSCRCPDDEL